MAPSNDNYDYYRRSLLKAWIEAIFIHAYTRLPDSEMQTFILKQLDLVARDFNVVLTWTGEDTVSIVDEI